MIEQRRDGRNRLVRPVNPVAGRPPGQMLIGGVAWLGMDERVSGPDGGRQQTVVFGSAHGEMLLDLLRAR